MNLIREPRRTICIPGNMG